LGHQFEEAFMKMQCFQDEQFSDAVLFLCMDFLDILTKFLHQNNANFSGIYGSCLQSVPVVEAVFKILISTVLKSLYN
jgi:hypothetical protein